MGSKTAIKERKPEPERSLPTAECRHHWIIESPQGALSSGRCKLCGEERQFRNSASDYIWDGDSSSQGGYGGYRGVSRTHKVAVEDDEGITAAGSSEETALAV